MTQTLRHKEVLSNVSESQENYLEAILTLFHQCGYVRSVDIAEILSVSKASVSRAVKLLAQEGMITLDEHRFIQLTDAGMTLAQKIADRHHTLQTFLIASGVPAEVAAQDACRLEHILSDISFEKIKNLLPLIEQTI